MKLKKLIEILNKVSSSVEDKDIDIEFISPSLENMYFSKALLEIKEFFTDHKNLDHKCMIEFKDGE